MNSNAIREQIAAVQPEMLSSAVYNLEELWSYITAKWMTYRTFALTSWLVEIRLLNMFHITLLP